MDLLTLLSQYGVSAVFAGIFYLLFTNVSKRDREKSDAALEKAETRAQNAEDRERATAANWENKYNDLNSNFNNLVLPVLNKSVDFYTNITSFLTNMEEQRKREATEREQERKIQEALDRQKAEQERRDRNRRSSRDDQSY